MTDFETVQYDSEALNHALMNVIPKEISLIRRLALVDTFLQ